MTKFLPGLFFFSCHPFFTHLGRRLHRGHRDSTNSLEAKNNRMQQQQLMDHSVVAPLTAEALNLLEVHLICALDICCCKIHSWDDFDSVILLRFVCFF